MRFAEYLLFAIACLHIVSFCVAQQSLGDTCRGEEGEKGVCQFIRDCPGVEDGIKQGVRPKLCGFQDRDPIACCIATGPQKVTSRVPGVTAQKWCEEYRTSCSKSNSGDAPPPVAGGHPADSEEFPHMAAIGYGDENDIKWHCGGTLISEKFVLTAAHCDSSPSVGPAKWVLLGTILLLNTTASRGRIGQIHPVIRRIRHPEYKPPAKYNDIALFEIGPAVTPNPRPLNRTELHPACLSSSRIAFAGSKAIATGWGRIGFADDGSANLLKVELDVFDLSVCQEAYEAEVKTSLLRNGIVPTMLCAGILEGKRDTCQGDSGGPLQVPLDRKRCMYEVLGVTSFGKVCAFPNSPSVYSKVFEYVPWIEDILWPA